MQGRNGLSFAVSNFQAAGCSRATAGLVIFPLWAGFADVAGCKQLTAFTTASNGKPLARGNTKGEADGRVRGWRPAASSPGVQAARAHGER